VRFQIFTGELHKLIGELAAKPPRRVERGDQRNDAARRLRNVIE